jgi:hypothetical protein
LNAANKLCDDLIEEELMAAEDHKEPPTKPSKPIRVHKKRILDQTSVRCSSRLKKNYFLR